MKQFRAAMLIMAAAAAFTSVGAVAQTAEVTLYTHGSWASELKPISHNAIFKGGIWDGEEPILMFTDRPYITNDRYVVLQLPPGAHIFGTGEGNKPNRKSQLTLTLEPGQRYFLRVHATSNQFTFPGHSTDFEPVTCQQAHDDLAHGTALSERAVLKQNRNLLSPAQQIPACP